MPAPFELSSLSVTGGLLLVLFLSGSAAELQVGIASIPTQARFYTRMCL